MSVPAFASLAEISSAALPFTTSACESNWRSEAPVSWTADRACARTHRGSARREWRDGSGRKRSGPPEPEKSPPASRRTREPVRANSRPSVSRERSAKRSSSASPVPWRPDRASAPRGPHGRPRLSPRARSESVRKKSGRSLTCSESSADIARRAGCARMGQVESGSHRAEPVLPRAGNRHRPAAHLRNRRCAYTPPANSARGGASPGAPPHSRHPPPARQPANASESFTRPPMRSSEFW
jgi:hypothetical protein